MAYQCLLLPVVYVGLGSQPHIWMNFRADSINWDIADFIPLVYQSSLLSFSSKYMFFVFLSLVLPIKQK